MDLSADQVMSQATQPEARPSRLHFRFNGTAGEYFRIWIVNLCLTILTLGIYSAWAKVRKNRYIYGSLELDQSYFDYLAQPLQILRGRLIAVFLLIAYVAAEYFLPLLGGALFLLLTLVTPWLIVRSRMFNMRFTAYRNIRFGFAPVYGEAYKVIFLYGSLSAITLGLAVPWAHMKRNQLLVDNTRFGTMQMLLPDDAKGFYFAYLRGLLLFALLAALVFGVAQGLSGFGEETAADDLTFLFPLVLFLLLYYVVGKFIAAAVLQRTTNGTRIGKDPSGETASLLGCDWKLSNMLWIYLTNIIAIVFSLGLLIPWAQMRALRYQLDNTWIDMTGNLDEVLAGQESSVSALGEEIGDVFDVDIGL
jgi:uncharacterized membrane protein YjgN (DUF898 family)